MKRHSRSPLGLLLIAGLFSCVPFLVGQGCVPDWDGWKPVVSPPIVNVIAPSVNRTAVAGDTLTVLYDALNPSTGSAGAIEVWAFYDHDGVYDGNEEVFATSLPSGQGKFTSLNTSSISPGTLYIGIAAENQAGKTVDYAPARITLGASAAVTFSSPQGTLTVGPGATVPIVFSAGTGVTSFNWSLFYDLDGVFDGDEFVIKTGESTASSVVATEWTIPLDTPVGTYNIGARVVTADLGENVGYADGTVIITLGPYLQILLPIPDTAVALGTPIPIVFAAGNPEGGDPMIRLFVDLDTDPANGNSTDLATVAASTGGFVWRSTGDFDAGYYYIGAEMIGVAPSLFAFGGPVQLLGSGDYVPGGGGGGGGSGSSLLLSFRAPSRDEIRFSGEQYKIRWSTNLTIGQGTIEVFREPDVNDDGVPDGADRRVVISPAGLDASMMQCDFDTTGVAGRYFIGGTVLPEGEEALTAYSKGRLTILPSTFWVGDLRTLGVDEEPNAQSLYFKGATFSGHNTGDNLGSDMLVADDYDGDGVQEIVLAAQFGKPWLMAQGGRGAGEAYMIYGSAGRQYVGNYSVNSTGSAKLPGLVFSGIAPNPHQPNTPQGLAGTSIPYTVDGQPCPPFSTEGLRSLTLIPDQDGDEKKELVFGFPFCNSYSLWHQMMDGTHPAPEQAIGRLENNGHFLRGGVVIVSSTNPLVASRVQLSRHFDRVMMLQEVGQVFNNMGYVVEGNDRFDLPAVENFIPGCCTDEHDPSDGIIDTAFFPGEGFMQDTMTQTAFPIFGLSWSNAGRGIDPPRLADPIPVGGLMYPDLALMIPYGETLSLSQIDSPPGPTSGYFVGGRLFSCGSVYTDANGNPIHPFGYFPDAGYMRVLGSGFYYDDLPDLDAPECGPGNVLGQYTDYCPTTRIATALEPFGCRILGQTTTQLFTDPPTWANRFAHSVSVSGDFLLIGAPNRTAEKADITTLRLDPLATDRPDSGTVYMLQLKRPGVPDYKHLWNSQGFTSTDDDGNVTVADNSSAPAPHNYIIQDVGYSRCFYSTSLYLQPGDVAFEMSRPFHIIGMPGDHIGDVTGLLDINNDGVDDFAVGGAGTNGDRGAVYVIYRRQPEIESDYLLERLQLNPGNLNRLNGLMILGRPGERLGTSIAGVGPRIDELKDDYNADGYPDLLIGSPYISSGGHYGAGEVFLLFGGQNLLSPQGGVTIPQLRDQGHGMVISGIQANGHVGSAVANAGDINSDGVADIMITAPDASPMFDSDSDGVLDSIGLDLDGDRAADDLDGNGTPDDLAGAGLVYIVFGGEHLTGTISLDQIGTENLPGIVVVGKKGGDHLGGGSTQDGLLASGISSAGDMDGDGFDDILLSSVLADPDGKTDAGEVYLIYGFSSPITPRN
jgi:hypothetical protein